MRALAFPRPLPSDPGVAIAPEAQDCFKSQYSIYKFEFMPFKLRGYGEPFGWKRREYPKTLTAMWTLWALTATRKTYGRVKGIPLE